MSEIHLESEVSKKAPEYHELPPRHNSCQPSPDRLSHVMENEYETRKFKDRFLSHQAELRSLMKLTDSTEHDSSKLALLLQTATRVLADGSSLCAEAANIYGQRQNQDTELYIALSNLSQKEFDRAYASLERDGNRYIPKLAYSGLGLSATTFGVSNTTINAPVQPPRSFWKRIWKSLTRS